MIYEALVVTSAGAKHQVSFGAKTGGYLLPTRALHDLGQRILVLVSLDHITHGVLVYIENGKTFVMSA